MDSNISFQSRIKFVNKKVFIDVVNGKRIDHIERPVAFADEFFTNCVRSCTAGGIVTPQKEAYGFHILDDICTNTSINDRFRFDIKLFDNPPERALIIGGKKHHTRPFSMANFKLIKDTIKNYINNVSYFEQHTDYYAQSSIHYSLKDDTYTILTQYFKNGKEKCVESLKELLENFKNIKIAKGDELFIGEVKVSPNEVSGIFKK